MSNSKSINAVTTEKAFWQSMLMLIGIVLMFVVVGSAILVNVLNTQSPQINSFGSTVEGNHMVLMWDISAIDQDSHTLTIEKEINGEWMTIETGLSAETTRTFVANHHADNQALSYRLSIVDANGNIIEQELMIID